MVQNHRVISFSGQWLEKPKETRLMAKRNGCSRGKDPGSGKHLKWRAVSRAGFLLGVSGGGRIRDRIWTAAPREHLMFKGNLQSFMNTG